MTPRDGASGPRGDSPPQCLGPVAETARPRHALPRGAWDTHFHTLGPTDRFPYAATRRYTPPDAPFEAAVELHDRLGIDRGFVVHANTHGLDNSVFLDALARAGGRYFGVLRLTRSATSAEFRALHERGVRGVRFAFNPQHGGRFDRDEVEHVAGCAADMGWFAEFHVEPSMLVDLESWFSALPVDVVIDHFGRIEASDGIEQAPFQCLLRLAAKPHIWVKISGADRISAGGPPYEDVAPFAHALTNVAADRMLWGTDWPHTGYFDRSAVPSDAVLVDSLELLVPDERVRSAILLDNPRRLAGL